jgi:alanine-synthesizing transaminase
VILAGGKLINFSLFDDDEISSGLPSTLTADSEGFFNRLQYAVQHSFPRPTTLILSFPHNPTGVVADRGFFDRVVQFACDEGLIVLHDFAYSHLVFDGGHAPSILASRGAEKCCVEFTTLSKAVNLPGWRIGFAAGNTKLIGALKRIKGYLDYGAFQPLQIAAIQVLAGFEHIARDNLNEYAERRAAVLAGLRRAGFEFNEPKGGLFVFPRLGRALDGRSADEVVKYLIDEVGVVLARGVGFDPAFKDYVRVVYSESETRSRVAMDKLAECLR